VRVQYITVARSQPYRKEKFVVKAYTYRESGAMVYSVEEEHRLDFEGKPYTMIVMSDGVAFNEDTIEEFFTEVVNAQGYNEGDKS
jgi:hypothetical protein